MIEIKDAVVYRNGAALDEPYAWNECTLSKKEYAGIAGYIEKNGNHSDMPSPDSTSIVRFTNVEYKKISFDCKKGLLAAW